MVKHESKRQKAQQYDWMVELKETGGIMKILVPSSLDWLGDIKKADDIEDDVDLEGSIVGSLRADARSVKA